MKPVTKEVKTLWAGRAWVHAKYLNLATKSNVPLVLVHGDTKMTVQPQDFRAKFDRQKEVEDRFKSGVVHRQYGIVWKKDGPKADCSLLHNNGDLSCLECAVTKYGV